MAAEFGFIYVLRNECMPGIYKIGMTDRSPRQRCAELSASTSVPAEFVLVCVAEVRDALAKERSMHDQYCRARVSGNREFFRLDAMEASDVIAELECLADKDGGMFWEDYIHVLLDSRQKEFEATVARDAVERFLEQSADPIHWGCSGGSNEPGFSSEMPF